MAVEEIMIRMCTSVLQGPMDLIWVVLRTIPDLGPICLEERDNIFLRSLDPTPTLILTISIIVILSLRSIITSSNVSLHSLHLLANFQIRKLERAYY